VGWGKTFPNHIYDMGLISRINIKNSYNSTITTKEKQIAFLKMRKGLEYTFLQRRFTNGQ
jgi:hypothetical protein